MWRASFFLLALIGCTASQGTLPPEGGVDGAPPNDASLSDRVYSQDGSVCKPKDLTGFQPPMFTSPVPAQNVCTPAQIQAFWDKCVGDQASTTACQIWSANNKACNACVATAESATAWGALVYGANGYRTNPSGCIATLGFLHQMSRHEDCRSLVASQAS